MCGMGLERLRKGGWRVREYKRLVGTQNYEEDKRIYTFTDIQMLNNDDGYVFS
jgi:hypothetical protein